MAISFSLSKKVATPSEAPKVAKDHAKPVNACKNLGFGVDSDTDDAGSSDSREGCHPLSKRTKLSHKGSDQASPSSVPVAAECKPVRITYKEYDLSPSNLDPELYLYDTLEDDSTKDGNSTGDTNKLLYLGCAPSDAPADVKVSVVKDSQYMKGLIRTARDRQIERSIAFDKQQLKEDLESGEAVGEVFVTGAYKRKLEERRRFEEEQRRKDEEDLRNSGKGVASLHAHMLKSGIASRTNRRS